MKTDEEDFSDNKETVHKFTQKEIESMFIDEDLIVYKDQENTSIIILSKIDRMVTHKKLCEFLQEQKITIRMKWVHFCYIREKYSLVI